jgi:hypothetical protein
MLKIPLNKVAEGADLCLENASQFCSDARILGENSSCEHALGLCILALEELGKATMLKVKTPFAMKKRDDVVSFELVSPEVFFHEPLESLKKRGFQDRKINPFYHHLSKLLYIQNMRLFAVRARIMKSLDGKGFQNMDEMNRTIEGMWKQALEVDVDRKDLRELAFYVDYDQEKGEWSKGRLKLTSAKVKELITDIESTIDLIRGMKTNPQIPSTVK